MCRERLYGLLNEKNKYSRSLQIKIKVWQYIFLKMLIVRIDFNITDTLCNVL